MLCCACRCCCCWWLLPGRGLTWVQKRGRAGSRSRQTRTSLPRQLPATSLHRQDTAEGRRISGGAAATASLAFSTGGRHANKHSLLLRSARKAETYTVSQPQQHPFCLTRSTLKASTQCVVLVSWVSWPDVDPCLNQRSVSLCHAWWDARAPLPPPPPPALHLPARPLPPLLAVCQPQIAGRLPEGVLA